MRKNDVKERDWEGVMTKKNKRSVVYKFEKLIYRVAQKNCDFLLKIDPSK